MDRVHGFMGFIGEFGNMNSNVVLLIGQMEIIASLIVIGLVVQKLKLFTSDLIDALSAMMSRLILPLMLMTVIGSISRDDIIHSWRFFVCSVVCYAIVVALSKFIARFSGLKEPRRSMHALLMSFGNSGFIGIPLIVSMFPDTAGIAAASFSFVESTLYWVVGPMLINNGEKKGIDWRKMATPLTFSVFTGLVIVLLNINLNGLVLWDTMKAVGGTSKYFASIYIGLCLGRMGLKKLFGHVKVLLTLPVKLIISPLIAYFLFGKTGIITGDMLTMFIVLFATPAGMTLPILSKIAGMDGEYSSAGCMVSTVCCLVSMPFVIWLTSII